jgi:uncharacterized cupredoxin-like copper-binding protein
MFKTISAALIAASILAAPAIAATTSANTTPAPVTKSADLTKSTKANKVSVKANAKRHHARYRSHRSHKMTMGKAHKSPKVAAKHVTHPAKRG